MNFPFRRTWRRFTGNFKVPYAIKSIFSNRHLILLSLLSFIVGTSAFFITRIGDALLLSIFARLNHISQNFSLLLITFPRTGQENWTEGKVLFIYTVPYLIYAFIGIYGPHFFNSSISWKYRLLFTWVSFHFLLMVVSGMIAGIYEFRGLGVALDWIFVNIWVRAIGVVILSGLMIYHSRRYAWYFLRCIPHAVFRTDSATMMFWLRFQVMLSFIMSFILIIPAGGRDVILNYTVSLILGILMIKLSYRSLPLILQNKLSLVKVKR